MRAGLPPSRLGRLALLLAIALSTIAAITLAFLAAPVGAVMLEAAAALISDELVSVNREGWIVFTPNNEGADGGIILYPGGRVAPESYAPLARDLAEAGYLTVIAPMPLNLAVLNASAATEVIAAFPETSIWVVAGHSLGGAMAARFAYENPAMIHGLALLAAYPEAHIDLRPRDLPVASIYGDRDGLATVDEIERSFALLPTDARKTLIVGGNHAQFGWYGEQAGDMSPRISRREQQARVVDAILSLMREAGK